MYKHEEYQIRSFRKYIEAELNVSVRVLQDFAPPLDVDATGFALVSHTLYDKWSYFMAKIVAMTFSSFKEVLLIDADQIVLRDPTGLFDASQFKDTGALLWPDYWGLSFDPSLISIINRARRVAGWSSKSTISPWVWLNTYDRVSRNGVSSKPSNLLCMSSRCRIFSRSEGQQKSGHFRALLRPRLPPRVGTSFLRCTARDS